MLAGVRPLALPPIEPAKVIDGEFPEVGEAQAPPPFVAGEFPEMPAPQYHAIEAMSSSGAKKMLRSPQHYRLMRTTPNEPTPAMEFGTVVHCGVLEPDLFPSIVATAPECDKRSKDGKAEWAAFTLANAGRIAMKAEELARARRCIDAIRAHPAASKLLAGGRSEVSLFWEDGKYKVPCKCRWDSLNHGGGIDVKTTQDASPEGFARQAANLHYHVQAAHYISGHEHVLNESPQFFAFICVESEPPHAVACYVLPGNAILAGMHLVNRAYARYAEALATQTWPGYPETIDVLTLPKWALRFND